MHCPQCSIYTYIIKTSKICGYFACIASSCSQVASSGPYQVHWTFSIPMAHFLRCLIFRYNMQTGCTEKSSSCSTWITFLSMTWLASSTYFLSNDTWNTLWIHIDVGKESMYATCPILSRISNGSQTYAANFEKFPNLRELLLAFTFKNTWSPTLNSLWVLPLST